MDKERLEFAFCEVDHTHEECELLEVGGRCASAVDVWPSEIHEWVDEEGPEIFHDEDGAP